jgi:phosphoglycerate dehydrogenase-like enzyme
MTMRVVCPDGDPQYQDAVEEAASHLTAAGHSFTWHEESPPTMDEWMTRAGDADGLLLLLDLPAKVLQGLDRLKVISWTGTGVRRFVDVPLAASRGVTVCNVPSYGANAVAEHALALMLAASRGVVSGDRMIRRGEWSQVGGRELYRAHLGVIGAGPVGQRMLELGHALGMTTSAWTQQPDAERARRLGTQFVALPELMSHSDFVSVHVAHTKDTEGLVSAEMLSLLQPHAVLVNTARGEVIDQEALRDLLDRNAIAGAGIDVFSPEPPSPQDPLIRCERAVLTPHVAYNTPTATAELFRLAIENLLQYAAGAPINVVN